jgi:hypothetical protein
MTFLEIEKPLLTTYDEEGQDSGKDADDGDDDPTQAAVDCILGAATKRLASTQSKNAMRVFNLRRGWYDHMEKKTANEAHRIMQPVNRAEARVPGVS